MAKVSHSNPTLDDVFGHHTSAKRETLEFEARLSRNRKAAILGCADPAERAHRVAVDKACDASGKLITMMER